jgi:Na+/H+-dicarboxylate symporter
MAEQTMKKGGLFSWYFNINLLYRIMAGLVLGAVVGIVLGFSPEAVGPFVSYTKIFGDIFIRLLRMIVVPVIFFSLITGAASITPNQLGRVGFKTLLYYLGCSVISISIALVIANLLQPGVGLNMVGDAAIQGKAATQLELSKIFLNIIPLNPVESLAKGDVLPIIFFALCFGISLSVLRESSREDVSRQADHLFHICSAAAETMYKLVGGIMQYAPIGVFFLIAVVFAQQGPKVIGPLVFVTVVFYLALALHLLIGYGAILAFFKVNLFKFLRRAEEASITAFVTRSSNATLPISMRIAEEKLGVPRSISSFALPIGATVNMDGTSVYLAVGAIFIGNAVGMPLGFEQQITLMIVGTLAAIGSAGVPGAGAIMMLMVLEAVGLKVEAGTAVAAAYAMILGIDALFDMGRTCLNVTGDIAGVVVVAQAEHTLDHSKWETAPTD